MNRKVFFCFEPEDALRALIVRDSLRAQGHRAAGFIPPSAVFSVTRHQAAMQDWIDAELEGTSVTVVLVGARTSGDLWVHYVIEKSIERGNAMLGIDVSKIRDLRGNTTERCERLPHGYDFYMWLRDDGANYLDMWIEKAAEEARV